LNSYTDSAAIWPFLSVQVAGLFIAILKTEPSNCSKGDRVMES
jgi:hypothetical protein